MTPMPGAITRSTGAGTGWDKGGSLIGIFTAGAETEAFKLTTTGWTTFNALQVRQLDK